MTHATRLEDGRIFLDYGPVQMVIDARLGGVRSAELAEVGADSASAAFGELCKTDRAALKRPARENIALPLSGVFARMNAAALATGDSDATPMIAVAGSLADAACAALKAAGAETAICNNGGDIALYTLGSSPVTVGILTDLASGKIEYKKSVTAADGIGGIATSGFSGRSFSLGIASAAVVFAADAATADALATILANSATANDPHIHRRRAAEIDGNTDIPNLMVTTAVEPLPRSVVNTALTNARVMAQRWLDARLIFGAVITVQGRTVMVPKGFCEPI